jgi:3-hydroxy-9,10-secoandrosta-1,3,5(10)-triene-9,17-dione monooxygenase
MPADSPGRPSATGLDPAFIDWLKAQAPRNEAAGRILDDVATRLAQEGLFALVQPRRYGGQELSLRRAYERTLELARGCPSCAWVVGLGTANVLTVSKFSARALADVFECGRPPIITVLTPGASRGVDARRETDGVRLTGKWHYASGIDVASWAGLVVDVKAAGQTTGGEPHMVLVPQSDLVVDHASWNTLGMRGTGSKTVSLDRVLVPEHRTVSWALLQSGAKHPDCPNDGPLYDVALTPSNALSVLVPTLGVALAAAEEFRALARTRVTQGVGSPMREDKLIQVEAAAAEASLGILRDAMLADTDLVEDAARQRRALSLEERTALRMRIAQSSRLALAATQRLFQLAGGSLLPSGTRLERLFRDLNAMSSHFLLQPEPIGEAYGRLLLGLEVPPGARL